MGDYIVENSGMYKASISFGDLVLIYLYGAFWLGKKFQGRKSGDTFVFGKYL